MVAAVAEEALAGQVLAAVLDLVGS